MHPVITTPSGLMVRLRPNVRCPCSWQLPEAPRRCLQLPRQSHPQRSFQTSARALAVTAPDGKPDDKAPMSSIIPRVVPASPSYFTGTPDFTDGYIRLQALLRKYQALPVVQPGHAPRIAWKTMLQYRSMLGEQVRSGRYHRIVALLHRLNHIHPSLMPDEVREVMKIYKRDVDPFANRPRPRSVDDYGRAWGLGRRKTSSAQVWLVEGEGEVIINGKNLSTAFPRLHDRESAIWALKATSRVDKYNVWALVRGGGSTGQAEALTLGVARALMVHEPLLKPALRRAGCVTRDPRRVERKKPGKLKARKMPAWVKR